MADDPWRRRLARWGIRDGFLVQPVGAPVPTLAPAGSALLALLVFAFGVAWQTCRLASG